MAAMRRWLCWPTRNTAVRLQPPPIARCERRTRLADLAVPPQEPSAGGQPGSPGLNPGLKRSLGFRDLTLFYVVTILSIRWIATAAAAGPGTLFVWIFA